MERTLYPSYYSIFRQLNANNISHHFSGTKTQRMNETNLVASVSKQDENTETF